MALLAWRVSYEIAFRSGPLKHALLRLEPHIFVIFCSHAAGLAHVAGWSEHHALYPLLCLAQLALCVAAGLLLPHLLRPFPLLRGKRGAPGSPGRAWPQRLVRPLAMIKRRS